MVNGMSEDNIVSMQSILEQCRIFADSDEGQLPSIWRKVVMRVKSNAENSESDELIDKRIPLGERLASNTRVLDLKNGVLIIESDHPGWIQYLKFYQKFIIKGLLLENPNLKINSFAFRLKGNEEKQIDIYEQALEKARAEMEERYRKNEEEARKFFGE